MELIFQSFKPKIMKRQIIISMFVASFAMTFTACNNSATNNSKVEASTKEMATYTCPMHSEIVKDKPGDCPICGMELVKMETSDTTHMGGQMDADTGSMHRH